MEDLIFKFIYSILERFVSKNSKKPKPDRHAEMREFYEKIIRQGEVQYRKLKLAKEICEQSNERNRECISSMYDMVLEGQRGEMIRRKKYRVLGRELISEEEIIRFV